MAIIPSWAGGYVGIPFVDLGRDRDGCDCWGLVRMILAERAGVAVPCWATDYASEANLPGVLDLAGQQKVRGLWRRIEPGGERTFDVVEMTQLVRTAGCVQFLPIHAGVVVIPGTLMHVERITDSLLVDYRCDRMVRNRIVGFWRHRELDDAA